LSELEDIPVEVDRVGRAPLYVLAATILAIGACAAVVAAILGGELGAGRRSDIVELHLLPPAAALDAPTALELAQRARAIELARWHWADRAHARVIVPVEIAIDRYVETRR
jgi:hypothetical protein